ncbi:MAG: ABC transporter ATP-binding protein [Alicyclobacillaceae bacterium]|nr:ABC transporter ATP-binding protein [Alicyclobacillaceae bacterium]
MALLRLDAVRWRDVLRDISLAWPRGRLIGLVGPNGAGKSTLLRVAAGVWRPTAGVVTIAGMPLHRLSPRQRARHLAYMPQQLPEEAPYTVRQYVAMGRYAYGTRWTGYERGNMGREAVDAALRRMGLEGKGDVPINRLSGGERQRAVLARCLTQGSPVLLLDEPIASLDLHYQVDVLKQLRALAAEGYLVVIAIHHLELAARYCDEVVLLHGGRVTGSGLPAAVLTEAAVREAFGIHVRTYKDPFTGALRLSLP